MRNCWFYALAVVTGSSSALAQDADGFAAPNGQLGAELSISKKGSARAFGELGFYTTGQTDEQLTFAGPITTESYITSLSALVGGGYKITPDIEIEAILPLAFVTLGFSASGGGIVSQSDSETEVAVGNLHLGASYVHADGLLRMKLGGALEHGIWTIDPSPEFGFTLAAAIPARGGQDVGLWLPETLSIVTPSRIEYGDRFVGTGDGSLGLHIPTDGGDVDVSIQLNPGFGYYVTQTVLVGARLPFVFIPTDSGSSKTFLAFEPYGRFDLDPGFVNVRLTLNLDEPLGFAFDEGKFWGLHFGGGGTF